MARNRSKKSSSSQSPSRDSPAIQLKSLDAIRALPTVAVALEQTSSVYSKVKDSNRLFGWMLDLAETTCVRAAALSQPLVNTLEAPIAFVDDKVASSLSKIETAVPIIKEEPASILSKAKGRICDAAAPALGVANYFRAAGQQRVERLKDFSVGTVNTVLASRCGSWAVSGFDRSSAIASKLLDQYLPLPPSEQHSNVPPVPAADDPLRHFVGTVVQLGVRVTRGLTQKVAELKRRDLQSHIQAVVTTLHLKQLSDYLVVLMAPLRGLSHPGTPKHHHHHHQQQSSPHQHHSPRNDGGQ